MVCSTRAYLRYCLHYTSPDSQAELESGTVGHKILEAHFKGASRKEALRYFSRYRKWWNQRVEEGAEFKPRLHPDNVFKVIRAWLRAHPIDALPFRVPSSDFVEIGFQVPLTPENDIIMTGRLDLFVEDSGDQLAPLDHKFTGYIGSDWVDQFRINSQMSDYIYAAAHHTGKMGTRAYVNAIELGILPSSDRQCSKHKMSYSECQDQHLKWRIFQVNRTPQMLERWKADAIVISRRFAELKQLAEKKGKKAIKDLPMEGAFFNACRWCEFKNFCAQNRPTEFLSKMFVKDEWNPLSYAKGDERRK